MALNSLCGTYRHLWWLRQGKRNNLSVVDRTKYPHPYKSPSSLNPIGVPNGVHNLPNTMEKTLKCNNGMEIPVVGLGTYKSSPGDVIEAVKTAIDVGYRHIDCAWIYENENEVGAAIKEKISDGVVKREDLFITSKLWSNFHAKEKVVPMLKVSLKALQLSYVDLYLIHWPFAFKEDADVRASPDGYSDTDYLETWEGMEECVKLGLAKSIGISNFNAEQTDRLLKHCKIKPVCNQVEINPNFQQKKLIQFSKERGIVIVGYCPLGKLGETDRIGIPKPTALDPEVAEIARRHNKTPAQVVLNYLISLGISVIPKSVTKSRIIENLNVLDFKLNPKDTAYMDSCNKNKRAVAVRQFSDHKYYSFHSEF